MLATLGAESSIPKDERDEWAYEMKWDGVRAICTVQGGAVDLRSRNGKDMTPTFPELQSLVGAVHSEDAVLDGLSTPLPALSFEFTTIARAVADRCLARLAALGPYRFDLALGESQTLTGRWRDAPGMAAALAALPHAANSGDVYAVLQA